MYHPKEGLLVCDIYKINLKNYRPKAITLNDTYCFRVFTCLPPFSITQEALKIKF